MTRIELAFSAWEADVLPLNYTREATETLPKVLVGDGGQARAERVDRDAPGGELFSYGAVGENHGGTAGYSGGAGLAQSAGPRGAGRQLSRHAGVVQRQNISFPS